MVATDCADNISNALLLLKMVINIILTIFSSKTIQNYERIAFLLSEQIIFQCDLFSESADPIQKAGMNDSFLRNSHFLFHGRKSFGTT